MSNIIECHGLTKVYEYKAALSEIDLNIERGRIVGLLGPMEAENHADQTDQRSFIPHFR